MLLQMPLLPPPPPILLFRHPSQAIRLSRQSRIVSNIPPHDSICRDDFFPVRPTRLSFTKNAQLVELQTMLFQSMVVIKVMYGHVLLANWTPNRNIR
ncbi:hypothetical protein NPIL_6441 [Nephila pilipes]|uniref:Uncharacterized protein n=1 Tax=Nephila pilipes TaxID=299642 RepID=A0A8X6Q8R7_NEPPI|nr:hypothetical protein NPIL_6441 [Nephila pilipes]